MGIKLMKPKIDFAFKEIMMDDEVRKGFLSAVLKIKPEDIKETKKPNDIRNPHCLQAGISYLLITLLSKPFKELT